VEQQAIEAHNVWSPGISSYRTGLEMAEILAQLHLDSEAVIVAVLYRPVRESRLSLEQVKTEPSETALHVCLKVYCAWRLSTKPTPVIPGSWAKPGPDGERSQDASCHG
jgi:hypothetical protein